MKRLLLLVAVAACYEPTLEPCSVVCGANDPCPSGLTCGADFHCHASTDESSCSFTITVEIVDDQDLLDEADRLTARETTLSCPDQCTTTAEGGVELVLEPALGSTSIALFTYDGDCSGRTCRFLQLDRDMAVTATVTAGKRIDVAISGDGQGFVRSMPEGISCPGTCAAVFAVEDEVDLVAEPTALSRFRGWSGAACNEGDSCRVGAEAPAGKIVKLGASFDTNRLVVTPFGIDTTGDKVDVFVGDPAQFRQTCDTTCELLFDPDVDTKILLEAKPADNQAHRFLDWLGIECGASSNPLECSFVLPARTDQVGIALFERRPSITVLHNALGGVSIAPPNMLTCETPTANDGLTACQTNVDKGSSAALTAFPMNSTIEALWTSCPSQPGPPFLPTCALANIQDDLTVTVNFARKPTLTVSVLTGQASVEANGVQQPICNAFIECVYNLPLLSRVVVTHQGVSSGMVWAGMNTCPGGDGLQANPCVFDLATNDELTGF